MSKKSRDKRKGDKINIGGDQDKSIKTRYLDDIIKHFFNAEGNITDELCFLNSKKAEILQVYQEEKIKLGQFLNKTLVSL